MARWPTAISAGTSRPRTRSGRAPRSEIFLRHAVAAAPPNAATGWQCRLSPSSARRPKIGPHADAMRAVTGRASWRYRRRPGQRQGDHLGTTGLHRPRGRHRGARHRRRWWRHEARRSSRLRSARAAAPRPRHLGLGGGDPLGWVIVRDLGGFPVLAFATLRSPSSAGGVGRWAKSAPPPPARTRRNSSSTRSPASGSRSVPVALAFWMPAWDGWLALARAGSPPSSFFRLFDIWKPWVDRLGRPARRRGGGDARRPDGPGRSPGVATLVAPAAFIAHGVMSYDAAAATCSILPGGKARCSPPRKAAPAG